MFLAISQINHWGRWTADVSTTFLQGDPQEGALWAKIPKDASRSSVWLLEPWWLIKPIYSQVDTPKQWFIVARRRLENLGFRAHALDQCLHTFHDSNKQLISLVGLHVDNLLGYGKDGHPKYKRCLQLQALDWGDRGQASGVLWLPPQSNNHGIQAISGWIPQRSETDDIHRLWLQSQPQFQRAELSSSFVGSTSIANYTDICLPQCFGVLAMWRSHHSNWRNSVPGQQSSQVRQVQRRHSINLSRSCRRYGKVVHGRNERRNLGSARK